MLNPFTNEEDAAVGGAISQAYKNVLDVQASLPLLNTLAGLVRSGSLNFYDTFAEAVAALPVGQFFTTYQGGLLAQYERIAEDPGYAIANDSLTPISQNLIDALDLIVSDAVEAKNSINVSQGVIEQIGTDAAALLQKSQTMVAIMSITQIVGKNIYSSRAALEADLGHNPGTYALVVGDPVGANNDLYKKTGLINIGTWGEPLGIFYGASAEATKALQSVQAASNFYADLATGEAGTVDGDFFSINNGNDQIEYRQRTAGGSVSLGRPLTLEKLGESDGSEKVGFTPDYSAVTRSMKSKSMDFASVFDAMPEEVVDQIRARTYAADVSAYFETIQAAFPNGATIAVPPGLYPVKAINMTSKNVHWVCAKGAEFILLGFDGFDRGIFQLESILDAGFELTGGVFNLNGEGPKGIGVAGRIQQNYASFNGAFPNIKGISGPAMSAVFARRSSGIKITDVIVKNSTENGILFRNCGQVEVSRSSFDNIANWAVEISYTNDAGDGGAGPMPEFHGYVFTDCYFSNIDDLGLGTGNGGCIGGGVGSDANLGEIRNVVLSNLTAYRCYRGFQFEAPYGGTWISGLRCRGIDANQISQNVLTMVGVRSYEIGDIKSRDIGEANATAMCYQLGNTYPDVSVVILSSDFKAGVIPGLVVEDTRAGGTVLLQDGTIGAGALNTVTSATAAFAAGDVGKPITIANAGPQDNVVHTARIATVVDANTITLDYPAARAVAGQKFAYGGHCREGVVLNTGVSVELINADMTVGATSGLPAEPSGQAIRVIDISDTFRSTASRLQAPANGVAGAYGIKLEQSAAFAGMFIPDPRTTINGYGQEYGGAYNLRTKILTPYKSFVPDRGLDPGAAADTPGGVEVLYSEKQAFIDLSRATFEAYLKSGAFQEGETVTFRINLAFYDGVDGPVVEKSLTAVGKVSFDAGDLLKLNPDGAMFRAVVISMKSSVAGSTVGGKANVTARVY